MTFIKIISICFELSLNLHSYPADLICCVMTFSKCIMDKGQNYRDHLTATMPKRPLSPVVYILRGDIKICLSRPPTSRQCTKSLSTISYNRR